MVNKLYTYIITVDNGLSPCYDSGLFSLACCKPQIRRMINKLYRKEIDCGNSNIWIAGIRRDKTKNNKPFVVYLAKITAVINLEDYYNDNSAYSNRSDCNYRGVKTVENLPISFDSEDVGFKEYFPNIKALKGNEHGEFKDIKELYEMNTNNRKSVMKDICGKSVLLSNKFIHFSQINPNDNFALTKLLQPCFSKLLNSYSTANQRHNHSFDNWDEFFNTVKSIEFNAEKIVMPLDKCECVAKNNKKCNNKRICIC